MAVRLPEGPGRQVCGSPRREAGLATSEPGPTCIRGRSARQLSAVRQSIASEVQPSPLKSECYRSTVEVARSVRTLVRGDGTHGPCGMQGFPLTPPDFSALRAVRGDSSPPLPARWHLDSADLRYRARSAARRRAADPRPRAGVRGGGMPST
jgi:hypothetical protein